MLEAAEPFEAAFKFYGKMYSPFVAEMKKKKKKKKQMVTNHLRKRIVLMLERSWNI